MRLRVGAGRVGLAALAALCLAAFAGATAEAQSERYPPTPTDFDDEAEQRSSLWERVLTPDRDGYQHNLSEARSLANNRDDSSVDRAARLVAAAVDLDPDNPRAHWILGQLERRREQWSQCARALDRVFALEPAFQPEASDRLFAEVSTRKVSGRGTDAYWEWALDYDLALCLARAGQYESAIVHYKRILGRGVTDQAAVYLGLGEAYMALGRLGEAIAKLRTAERHKTSHIRLHYSLAVAYDRDEQGAQARAHLVKALASDRNLSRLRAPSAIFTPPADQYYYLGLAHASNGDSEWAIVYFRRYLHESPNSPWLGRVRQHLGDLLGEA
ncbi:MAG: tetratricopeptide repeat protein, partial [Myxococcota bacterium]